MRFLEVIFAVLVSVLIYKLVFYFVKRIRGICRVMSLKKECGAKIKFIRSPIAFFFGTSGKPDMAVELGETVYLLRLLNGKNNRRHMHFASKAFYVTFSATRITLGALLNVGRRYKVTRGSGYASTSRHSVKILPELEIPSEYKDGFKSTVPVLLLNPAPAEVTYVTEERTSIKAAFEGDEVYGQRIFTASTFFIYADRAKRESELFGAEKAIFTEE